MGTVQLSGGKSSDSFIKGLTGQRQAPRVRWRMGLIQATIGWAGIVLGAIGAIYVFFDMRRGPRQPEED